MGLSDVVKNKSTRLINPFALEFEEHTGLELDLSKPRQEQDSEQDDDDDREESKDQQDNFEAMRNGQGLMLS